VHVHVLARRGFFRLLLRAVELLPGEIWCAHASMIVLCVVYCSLQCCCALAAASFIIIIAA
jgi:hypothetical protein